MVWLKIRFCGYIREISDSAQAITARSQKNQFSKIQNLLTLHSQTIFFKIQVNYFNIRQFFLLGFEQLEYLRENEFVPVYYGPIGGFD